MVEVKPRRDIIIISVTFIHVKAIIDNVGDDDGTSRTPHISLPALPALPSPTVCQGPVLSVF